MRIQASIMIKGMFMRTRAVMAPMVTSLAEDGKVTDEMCKFYRERTNNEKIGAMIVEFSYIDKEGKVTEKQLDVSDTCDVETLAKLPFTIHDVCGVKMILQIGHGGKKGEGGKHPGNLTKEEIADIVKKFAESAARAKEAGFDGIEVHGAHGYLLSQFWSPLTNERDDEYGAGSVEDRTRLHVEVIKAIREKVGEDYPVGIRFGAVDHMEGGATLEDALKAAKILESAGYDFLDISGGMCGWTFEGAEAPGYFREDAKAIRDVLEDLIPVDPNTPPTSKLVPVITAGGVTKVADVEELLGDKACDIVSIGRQFKEHPKWLWMEMNNLENEGPRKQMAQIMIQSRANGY